LSNIPGFRYIAATFHINVHHG